MSCRFIRKGFEVAKEVMGGKYNEVAEPHRPKGNVILAGHSTCATLLCPVWPARLSLEIVECINLLFFMHDYCVHY